LYVVEDEEAAGVRAGRLEDARVNSSMTRPSTM
jgi:hypothetical protein